ncbi:putative methyltransferase-like protein [Mycena venus]|uniref:Putative methyltransferase-like protein n=1 Tax=Mycena venus TaxID=2733690 RepID=A0A8H6X3U6_9AGAR|nr:putative methyltransferase-like protein [Mycena venus]
MTSQYDAIGSKYNVFKTFPVAAAESFSLETTLRPYLTTNQAPRVLDLACGTGYYSHKLLEWGAASVLGVDLSPAMVATAAASVTPAQEAAGSLSFRVGDALALGNIPDEQPFDVVVGTWLLNYASTLPDMRAMFTTISANLREGGVFVGITPPQMGDDLDAFVAAAKAFADTEQAERWGLHCQLP